MCHLSDGLYTSRRFCRPDGIYLHINDIFISYQGSLPEENDIIIN